MEEQEHSWRCAQVHINYRAVYSVISALPKAEMCRILRGNMQTCKTPAVQLLGQKNLESWGYFEACGVLQLLL